MNSYEVLFKSFYCKCLFLKSHKYLYLYIFYRREKRDVPFIVTACVREVERRGVGEVGLYRVSGSASDLTKLRKSFESNSYEAEQLLKEVVNYTHKHKENLFFSLFKTCTYIFINYTYVIIIQL